MNDQHNNSLLDRIELLEIALANSILFQLGPCPINCQRDQLPKDCSKCMWLRNCDRILKGETPEFD